MEQIPTPNIDALALSGIALNNYYVQPLCTPSRAALMTGKYPIHTGMQQYVIKASEPYGVSLSEKFLPQYLGEEGYATHAVGKWHLGSFKEAYTPLKRGFETYYGFWKGKKDYYSYINLASHEMWGYDLRNMMKVAHGDFGRYSTDLFTEHAVDIIENHNVSRPLFLYLAHQAVHAGNKYDPIQAPDRLVNKFWHIKNSKRRKFAGMLSKLDESVGRVVSALQRRSMFKDSIIVFTTDNGGAAAGYDKNAASNWPLRGVKSTLWQGGVRGAGFVWSLLLNKRSYVYPGLIHITDLFPTLYSMAGGDTNHLENIDGVNMWPALNGNLSSPRQEVLLNIDGQNKYSALISGHLKYINGSGRSEWWNIWHGPSGRNVTRYDLYMKMRNSRAGRALADLGLRVTRDEWARLRSSMDVRCNKHSDQNITYCLNSECLFDLNSDPCEQHDLSALQPVHTSRLRQLMNRYRDTAVPPRNRRSDPKANPKYWQNVWTNWGDYVNITNNVSSLEVPTCLFYSPVTFNITDTV